MTLDQISLFLLTLMLYCILPLSNKLLGIPGKGCIGAPETGGQGGRIKSWRPASPGNGGLAPASKGVGIRGRGEESGDVSSSSLSAISSSKSSSSTLSSLSLSLSSLTVVLMTES